MESKVFISYSSKDKPVGDAACAVLERCGYPCWIAPRDILPGREWGEAIIEGIESSSVFVLVFSSNANNSPQIRREIERAVHHGLVVVPFRIEDVAPVGSMEYFMSAPHWLDALTPPLERHLEALAGVVGKLLDEDVDAKDGALAPAITPDNRLGLALLALLIAAPAIAGFLRLDPPWPAGSGYLSAALVFAAAASAQYGGALARWAASRAGTRTAAGLLTVGLVSFLALSSLYVETIPGTGIRVVKGFTCTADALLVYGDSCPSLGRDALRDAEWEAPTLWTATSLMLVRVGLVVCWLAFVAGLALVAESIGGKRGAGRHRRRWLP